MNSNTYISNEISTSSLPRLLTKAERRMKQLESVKKEISLGLKFQNLLAMQKIWTTMPGDMQRGVLAAQREGRAYVAPDDNEPAAKRVRIEETDYSNVTFLPPPVEELQEIQQDDLDMWLNNGFEEEEPYTPQMLENQVDDVYNPEFQDAKDPEDQIAQPDQEPDLPPMLDFDDFYYREHGMSEQDYNDIHGRFF
ncbi:hypothetical protein B9Z55_000532 [Caenorhabditis nigoni]|uniref:Uncharacterized protein n=1 Tax=Caenorhabditis nigoni TaxID=1611254 RepID=A0A2G5VTG0_9PELO|nr:hypothetical protein B9Z55_000532 [Caenorhabditis nigoni]